MTKIPFINQKDIVNGDSWNEAFDVGVDYFAKQHYKFYDFSFVMIREFGTKVIPVLKSVYLALCNYPDYATDSSLMTLYKDVKKMNTHYFSYIKEFTEALEYAVSRSQAEIFSSGLDKKYFIKDNIILHFKENPEFKEVLQLITADIIDRVIMNTFYPMIRDKSRKLKFLSEDSDLTDYEQLCLLVYAKKQDLFPSLRELVYKPANDVEKTLTPVEIHIIEYIYDYAYDIKTIIWKETIKYLSAYRTKRLDKAKDLGL